MPLARVNRQPLSLWQSAVAEVARRRLAAERGSEPRRIEILEHPAVRATDDFVRLRRDKADPGHEAAAPLASESADPHARNVYLAGLVFDIAQARLEGRTADEERLLDWYWPFSDKDPHFLECPAVYLEYYALHDGRFLYNDWKTEGGDSLDYGVVQWPLPDDAKVGLIGDWGTGMADAQALLKDLMVVHRPAALVHLGDIYYSGTPYECKHYFADVIKTVFDEVLGRGKRIPVFTIPGNHDYYALGYGFYPMLSGLNSGIDGAEQQASYFCLRTQDGGWQLLGMDSGYEDSNPENQVDPLYAGPWLQPDEIAWHRDKLLNFDGATILLSHHQLYTAHGSINGVLSSESEFPYLNPSLLNAFEPFFGTKIAAWLWGHEHNFVLFRDGLFGLARGRLLGASAFEEATDQSPYSVKHPSIPYLDPTKYQLTAGPSGYYAHSYGVIDFSVRESPTDPVSVSYYQFPSWYEDAPDDPQSTFIFSESYALPTPTPQAPVTYGTPLQLSSESGLLFVGPLDPGHESYPTLGPTPVTLRLLDPDGGSGELTDGALALIQTGESAAGTSNLLGAWATRCLYYYSSGYEQEVWTLRKLDTSGDDVVRFGDAVSIVNGYSGGEWIAPTNDGYLTTTSSGAPTTFTFQPPASDA